MSIYPARAPARRISFRLSGFGILELEPLGVRTTVIEPGYFRTTFLSDNSVVSTASRMQDYAKTVGVVRDFAAGANGQQRPRPGATE